MPTPGSPTSPAGVPGAGPIEPSTPMGLTASAADPTAWEHWWRYNGEAYLRWSELLAGRERRTRADGGPDYTVLREVVQPALLDVLKDGDEVPVLRNALVAWARLRQIPEPSGRELEKTARYYMTADRPELVESAILALGVRADASAIPLLVDLLHDSPTGREVVGGRPVGARNRAFAAFSLGLLGAAHPEERTRLEVVHELLSALGDERTATRELQVACALSAGHIPIPFCGDDPERLARHQMEGDAHLCGSILLNFLVAEVFQDTELDEWLRAHVAPAMGRLAREAPDHVRAAVAETLLVTLEARDDVAPFMKRGCVLGLGLLGDADADAIDARLRKELARQLKQGEPLTQRFALIALAQVAGRPGAGDEPAAGRADAMTLLLRHLGRGKNGMAAWAALAAGVSGWTQHESHEVASDELARALRLSLTRTKDPASLSAAVLGIAVLRDESAADLVLQRFRKIDDPAFRARAGLTLGLIGNHEAAQPIRDALLADDLDPRHALELAIGLRLLGDATVVPELLERYAALGEDEERAGEYAVLTDVLGSLADDRAAQPLATTLASDAPLAVRAAAAHALGTFADPHVPSWGAALMSDLDYTLLTWTLRSPLDDGSGIFDLR